MQDISDFIRATVTGNFEIVRYGERISLAIESFAQLEAELALPPNPIEERMNELLGERIEVLRPSFVGFTVPFPGCLLATLRCAQFIRNRYPGIRLSSAEDIRRPNCAV